MAACTPIQVAFFARMVPLMQPMATRLSIDVDYLLALCAFEDAWGHDAHNEVLHNLFGLTQAGGRNLGFASDQACCDYWEAHYGALVTMKDQKMRSYIVVACALLTPFLPVKAGAEQGAPVERAGVVRVPGPYINVQYGFRFSAPSGLAIYRDAAPAPNHGASVKLGKARRIEVSAAFDAPEYGSTAALMSARISGVCIAKCYRRTTMLGGRAAEESSFVVAKKYHTLIVRHEGQIDDGINYTVELTSTLSFKQRDRARLDQLLSSFQFAPRQ